MIGLRELVRRKRTFALIAAVVTLIAYLVVMINGLGLGFREQFGSALDNFDGDAIAFDVDADRSVYRSVLDQRTVDTIAAAPGVTEAAAMGYVSAEYRDRDGGVQSASFFGYEPGSIAEPPVVEGRPLSASDDHGLLVDSSFLADSGLDIGDRITVRFELREMQFTMVGSVREGSFGFLPAVYMLRETWQDLRFGSADAESPAASIVLLDGDGLADIRGPGFEIVSKSTAFASIEGLSDADGMVWALRIFGYTIGAAVIGVFFYVLTLHKVSSIGLLKALGASNRFVAGQTVLQAGVVVVVGLTLSVLAAILTQDLLASGSDEGVPLVFTTATYVATTVSFAVTALVAVAFSVRSIVRIDPIIALAQQQ
jgi:putative ABC transport system permease protein